MRLTLIFVPIRERQNTTQSTESFSKGTLLISHWVTPGFVETKWHRD